MCKRFLTLFLFLCLSMLTGRVFAGPFLDAKAPDFQGIDLQGKPHRLSNYIGKIVVLEWSSPECPYSRRYYENGTLDSLYEYAREKGIVWINIVPALQKLGREEALKHLDLSKKIVILDSTLEISTTYEASTTPQILIINKKGILAYTGAIDSTAMLKTTASNVTAYTHDALEDLLAERPVAKKITRPFGCYIKNNIDSDSSNPSITGNGSR